MKNQNSKSRRWLANIGIGALVVVGLAIWVMLP